MIGKEIESLKSTLKMVVKHVKAKPNDSVLELSDEKAKIIQKAFKISEIESQTVIKNEGIKKGLRNSIL